MSKLDFLLKNDRLSLLTYSVHFKPTPASTFECNLHISKSNQPSRLTFMLSIIQSFPPNFATHIRFITLTEVSYKPMDSSVSKCFNQNNESLKAIGY